MKMAHIKYVNNCSNQHSLKSCDIIFVNKNIKKYIVHNMKIIITFEVIIYYYFLPFLLYIN